MALGPGPAGLKFWTPQGLTADNTADINDLPAGIGDQFNPWGPKRPVQDWVRGVSPLNMPVGTLFAVDAGSYALTGGSDIATLLGDNANLPAGNTGWFNPWGARRGRQDWVRGVVPVVPVVLTAAGSSYALTGSAALFGFGQVGTAGSYALTGSAAAQALGQTAASGSYVLTGSAAGTALGQAAGAGSYALTGSAAAQAFGQVVGAGSYALTGSTAATAYQQRADSGSYALTGSAATFAFGQGVPAGAYTLTGADAAFVIPGVVDYLPAGMTGGYASWRRQHPVSLLTGTSRVLAAQASVVLTASAGSYVLTGADAALTVSGVTYLPAGMSGGYNPWRRPYPVTLLTRTGRPLSEETAPVTLTAAGGSYALTGASAALALRHVAGAGAYTITGTAATFAFKVLAGSGAYNLTGSDANLVQAGTITLTCGAGSYLLTGFDVSFVSATPPPVEVTPPTPGGAGVKVGRGGRPLYKRLKLKKKRKREECEELLEYLENLPPLAEIERADLPSLPTTLSLLDCIPPLSRPQVRAAINKTPIRDDDDDEDAIALLLEFL